MYRRSCCRFIAISRALSLITFTEIPLPFSSATGSPEGPTFPSRLHCDLRADVATAGSRHGCRPDVVLFTTGKVCDAVEEHLWVGLVLTGRLGQRACDVMSAKCDKTVTRQTSWPLSDERSVHGSYLPNGYRKTTLFLISSLNFLGNKRSELLNRSDISTACLLKDKMMRLTCLVWGQVFQLTEFTGHLTRTQT